MSFWKVFFQPFRLVLGAIVFFLILNPGVLVNILATLWYLVSNSWLASTVVVVVVFGLLLDIDSR